VRGRGGEGGGVALRWAGRERFPVVAGGRGGWVHGVRWVWWGRWEEERRGGGER